MTTSAVQHSERVSAQNGLILSFGDEPVYSIVD